MTSLPGKVEINLAAIPVTGFGGLCLVVASLVCAVALPPTRWFMLAAIAFGIVFGVALILIRRAGERAGPIDGDPPLVTEHPSSPLFGSHRSGSASASRFVAALRAVISWPVSSASTPIGSPPIPMKQRAPQSSPFEQRTHLSRGLKKGVALSDLCVVD